MREKTWKEKSRAGKEKILEKLLGGGEGGEKRKSTGLGRVTPIVPVFWKKKRENLAFGG